MYLIAFIDICCERAIPDGCRYVPVMSDSDNNHVPESNGESSSLRRHLFCRGTCSKSWAKGHVDGHWCWTPSGPNGRVELPAMLLGMWLHAFSQMCTYTRMYLYLYIHICICMHLCVQNIDMCITICIYVYIDIFIYIYIYTHYMYL